MQKNSKSEYGGSALEYLVVSIFSILLAIASIHFVRKVVIKHADEIEKTTGIKLEIPDIFGKN